MARPEHRRITCQNLAQNSVPGAVGKRRPGAVEATSRLFAVLCDRQRQPWNVLLPYARLICPVFTSMTNLKIARNLQTRR